MLKAKNVFFPETEFFLEPTSSSDSGGKEYVSLVSDRTSQKLNIVRRDSENEKIVLSYDPNKLYSGYYNIVVKNPLNTTTSLSVLILVDRTPRIEKDLFAYDENYKTYTVTLEKGKTNNLSVTGYNFSTETNFSFKPTTEGIPYPFASELERKEIPLSLNSNTALDDSGRMKLDLSLNANSARTGYYKLVAENENTGTDEVLLLVKIKDDENLLKPYLKSVSSKIIGDSLTFIIKGDNLLDANFYLISAVSGITGENVKISLTLLDTKWSGAKLILDAAADKFDAGDYAIMAEKNNATSIQYVKIDSKMHASINKKVDEEKVTETYLRPSDFVEEQMNYEDIPASVEETPRVVEVIGKNKYFMPFLFFDVDMNDLEYSSNDILFTGMFSILDLGWFSIKSGASYGIINGKILLSSSADFALPGIKYFLPYAGAGISLESKIQNISEASSNFSSFPGDINLFINKLNVPFYCGVVLFNFLDFKYSCVLNNVLFTSNSVYFSNSFSIGCRFPLRQKTYKKKTQGNDTTISKHGAVDGNDVVFNRTKTISLIFENGVTKISNFTDMKELVSVTLPDSLEILGTEAFANCIKLNDVSLPDGLKEIEDYVFLNCKCIHIVSIPYSVTKISSKAFAQSSVNEIKLNWNSDDETERDLSGLEDFENCIVYKDGSKFSYNEISH